MHKNLKQTQSLEIGEVYTTTLAGKGSVQHGRRPVVVIQNNTGNFYSPNVIVAPMTSVLKKLDQPTHILIKASNGGLKEDSFVLCENPVTIPQSDLEDCITKLSDVDMSRITEGFLIATGLGNFVNREDITRIQKKTAKLNKVN